MVSGSLAALNGESPAHTQIRRLQEAARAHPRELRNYLDLAEQFIIIARTMEDPSLYVQANDAVRRAREVDPQSVLPEQIHARLLLQDHRFREARDVARALSVRGRPAAETWGVLSDSLLELGDYPGAVDAAQRMVDTRPDSQSYVRAAWLRWMHGDAEGAIEVMRLALDALPRLPEPRAWIITQMGVLYWNTGDLATASQYFDSALNEHAPFSDAHAGRARIALARNDTATAATEALAAVHASPTAEHEWLAGDALAAAGRAGEARAHYESLERIGLRTDPRTLSLYYSTTAQRAERALELANREHDNRQDAFTDDAVAWALYRNHQIPAAREAITRARRSGIRDARIVFHAGMIANAAGDAPGAITALTAAMDTNPFWNGTEADEARRTLTSLGAPVPPLHSSGSTGATGAADGGVGRD